MREISGSPSRSGPRSQFASEDVNTGNAAIKSYRDVWLQWVSGSAIDAEVVTSTDIPGIGPGFYFSQGVGEAKATVVWDGAGVTNTIDHNLTEDLTTGAADRFLLDIANVTNTGMMLTMTVYSASGADAWATSPVYLAAGGERILSLLYSDFTQHAVGTGSFAANGSSADFSNVGAIVLELNGVGHAGSDIQIRSIGTATPEPSTLAMAVIVAIALLGLSKRWR